MALVRDPAFWKRFSMAARKEEETKKQKIVPWDPERAESVPSSLDSMKAAREHDNWLEAQERKKRKYKAIALGVCCGILIVVVSAAVTASVVKRKP